MSHVPIFIMSSERSGSNLLRVLLNNHRDIGAPLTPHFLKTFKKIIPYYGPLESEMGELLKDMVEVANHPYINWNLNFDHQAASSEVQPARFMAAYDFIYRQKVESEGKKHFVSKDNNIFDYTDLIFGHYDNPKIIYLYRDVRDQAVSWMKTPTYMLTPKVVANHWSKEQRKCLDLYKTHSDNIFKLSYEELISDSEQAMQAVIDFIGVEWDARCAQTNKEKAPEASRNEFWKNLDKPILASNSKKYLDYFDKTTIAVIESIASKEMLELGYDLESNGNYKQNRINRYLWNKRWVERSKKLKKEQLKDNELQYSKSRQIVELQKSKKENYSFYY